MLKNDLRQDLMSALERIADDKGLDAFNAFHVLRTALGTGKDKDLDRALAKVQYELNSRQKAECGRCIRMEEAPYGGRNSIFRPSVGRENF